MKLAWLSQGWTLPALVLAAAIAYVALGLIPSFRDFQHGRQELALRRTFITQAAGLPQALEETRREMAKTADYNRAWREAAPRAANFPTLLGRLNALANEAGVTPTRVDPDPIRNQSRLGRIPLVVCCQGGFDQTFQFLQSLESLPISAWMKDLRMEVDPKNRGIVKAELDLEIFAENSEISGQVDFAK